MLRLKAQKESGEWEEFNISQVYDVCRRRWYIDGYPNDYTIDPATLQLADDPRKAMLNEIREKINNLTEYKTFVRAQCVIWILDEMEAKL